MERINHPTALEGMFTDGNPVAGLEATVLTAAWANHVQEELARFIEAAGLVLDPADYTQLQQALVAMGLRAATQALTGVMRLATAAEVVAGTAADVAVSPATLKSGYLSSLLADGYAWFHNGLLLQWGYGLASNTGNAMVFPIVFPTAVLAMAGMDRLSVIGAPHRQSIMSLTTSGFIFVSSETVPEYAFWIALGH